jgi:MFS family permease
LRADLIAAETALERFLREMKEGLQFLRDRPRLILLGVSWAMFLGAMLTGGVVTAPLSDKVFHAGAVGYGWLNAGWGSGAFFSVLYTPFLISFWGARRSMAISMGALAIGMSLVPLSPVLWIAVVVYFLMGSGRGTSGVSMNTSLMKQVPPHFMGRVQNSFYFAGTFLQIALGLLVGAVAQANLVAGFCIIGLVYAVAFACSSWPVKAAARQEANAIE